MAKRKLKAVRKKRKCCMCNRELYAVHQVIPRKFACDNPAPCFKIWRNTRSLQEIMKIIGDQSGSEPKAAE